MAATPQEPLSMPVPEVNVFQGSVLKALKDKNIFITGATGFVGKALVEKLLRSVPIGKIFLLVRPRKGSTATERMREEIVSSKIFTRLRSEIGDAGFERLVSEKLVAVAGELTQNNVGLSKKDQDMLHRELDAIIHCAAIVDFNERLDRAVELNVMGSLRMMEIAKKCKHLGAFIHVSTCYVNSNRRGLIDEKIFPLGFDPEAMIKKVRNLTVAELEKIAVTGLLGDWPNTYTFTKAMAEHLLVKNRGSVPLAIVRPSIIGSAWKEPEPGWVDVISAAGAVYTAVGFGVIKFLPGRPTVIADVVPVDYVINSMLAAIPAIMGQNRWFVCHSATSSEKPMHWGVPAQAVKEFWAKHPPPGNVSSPDFRFITNPQGYQLMFFLKYSVPSALLNTLAMFGTKSQKSKAQQLEKLVWRVRVIVEAFRHFVENEWIFDNRNTRTLYRQLPPQERAIFDLDLAPMDWHAYNTAFAHGIHRNVLKVDVVPWTADQGLRSGRVLLNQERWKPEDASIAKLLFPDLDWASRMATTRPSFRPARPAVDMRATVFASAAVQAAIKREAEKEKLPVAQVEGSVRQMLDKMCGESSLPVISGMGWFFKKIWRRIYESVEVDAAGLAAVRAAAARGPLIFAPTHRSYVDFLIVSYICFSCQLPMPFIAAGEDFLGILLVRWLFRNAGAFFLRRSFTGDDLYSAVFKEYVTRLLADGQSLEFFVEGTRSRSGKMLQPKLGFLTYIADAYLEGRCPDASMVPVTINYEKTIEGELYSSELLGEKKIRESLKNLLRSSSVLAANFGKITVTFGEPLALSSFVASEKERVHSLAASVASAISPAVSEQGFASALTCVLNPYVPIPDNWSQAPTTPTPSSSSSTGAVVAYDPKQVDSHRKHFVRQLGYRLTHELNLGGECMPTHVLASLLLLYRQGATKDQLIRQFEWLRLEILARGGRTAGMATYSREALVQNALSHLGSLVIQRNENVYEPNITARSNYKNMLVLGYYRNKFLHLFFVEGLIACVLYALGEGEQHGVSRQTLLSEVRFIYSLLHREVILQPRDEPENLEAGLERMVSRGILSIDASSDSEKGGRVTMAPTGEVHFSFLCSMLWPFIDSYYVAALALVSLQTTHASKPVHSERKTLLTKTQTLATTLYHESMLCFYESCSLETLNNALHVLKDWNVVQIKRQVGKVDKKKNPNATPSVKEFVALQAAYQSGSNLSALVERISRLRKQPPVRRSPLSKNMIAEIPILAKL